MSRFKVKTVQVPSEDASSPRNSTGSPVTPTTHFFSPATGRVPPGVRQIHPTPGIPRIRGLAAAAAAATAATAATSSAAASPLGAARTAAAGRQGNGAAAGGEWEQSEDDTRRRSMSILEATKISELANEAASPERRVSEGHGIRFTPPRPRRTSNPDSPTVATTVAASPATAAAVLPSAPKASGSPAGSASASVQSRPPVPSPVARPDLAMPSSSTDTYRRRVRFYFPELVSDGSEKPTERPAVRHLLSYFDPVSEAEKDEMVREETEKRSRVGLGLARHDSGSASDLAEGGERAHTNGDGHSDDDDAGAGDSPELPRMPSGRVAVVAEFDPDSSQVVETLFDPTSPLDISTEVVPVTALPAAVAASSGLLPRRQPKRLNRFATPSPVHFLNGGRVGDAGAGPASASGSQDITPVENELRTKLRQDLNPGDTFSNLMLFESGGTDRAKVSLALKSILTQRPSTPADAEELDDEEGVQPRPEATKLGTIAGVYLPTIQNIFGVLLFLRLSWIVGVAGAGGALGIVLISCTTTFITAISMSAIATNGVVPAGGAYYMISRSLGPGFGGAVGILFYLGTTFAAGLYVLGAIELMLTFIAPSMSLFDGEPGSQETFNDMRIFGTILLLGLAGIVYVGVKAVNKFATFFLACVLVAITCIYLGYFSTPRPGQPRACFVDGTLIRSEFAGNCTPGETFMNSTLGALFPPGAIFERPRVFPGLQSNIIVENSGSTYFSIGEARPGQAANAAQVEADVDTSFTILLAIFFPSVTGIMAGSNRSGDLKDPSKSIPRGTIAAILTTTAVYVTSVLFLAGTTEGEALRDKFSEGLDGRMLIADLSWPSPWIVMIGALLSTIGAGMQSLVGAPRLLQAIAKDQVIPPLGRFAAVNKAGEPTAALFLTFCIAEIGVLIASLDAVAPIITMFFLMCYGFVNLACVLQSLLEAPNWRPKFRYYHWVLSASGLALCLALMFVSSFVYAIVAIVIAVGIYVFIQFKGAANEWGDGWRGLSMQFARYSLLRLEGTATDHTKNWRPQVLGLVRLDEDTYSVVEDGILSFAQQLKQAEGLTIIGSIMEGRLATQSVEKQLAAAGIRKSMERHHVHGFSHVLLSTNTGTGMDAMLQVSGLGALHPNTVLLGWPDRWRERRSHEPFVRAIQSASTLKQAALVLKPWRSFPDRHDRLSGSIDVWWVMHDGGLLLLLAFLLKKSKVWKRCDIRVFTVAEADDNSLQIKADLKRYLSLARIKAEVHVVEMVDYDISAYTYERTLRLEERKNLLKAMRVEQGLDSQVILGRSHKAGKRKVGSTVAEDNVRRMNTSVKLNAKLKELSHDAELIIVNLPDVPSKTVDAADYTEFLEVLTEGIDNKVMLVRGGGREVITLFS